jgi:hypothetical protein
VRYLLLLLISIKCFAYDQDLADRLKEDLEHESNRRKAFREFEDEKKKTEKEQNRGLSLWLEEQEQWDLTREKAIFELRKDRRVTPGEGSPEHLADLAEKARAQRVVEEGRKNHIAIKNKIIAQYQPRDNTTEEIELGLDNNRPRYDLRKRGRNKWAGKGGTASGGSSGASGGGFNSGGFQNDNYDFPPPPPPDFNNGMPQDNFEDFPPPPPPPGDFGNAPGTFDSGFGDAPIPPPPPPPPDGGWDF